jgi:nicotinate-nucleotide adenylyltransferase
MRHLAIFGGTFNPVHCGHLQIAEVAIRQTALNSIIWVPTFQPPHKSTAMPTFHHRLEMVRRAIAPHSRFIVSDVEAQNQGVSYASATLRSLQLAYPDTCWYWLLGIDTFQTLPRWRDCRSLAEQCTWLVAPRRGGGGEGKERRNGVDGEEGGEEICGRVAAAVGGALRWQLLSLPPIAISSSTIRQRCREGKAIDHLVPESVRLYIKNEKLYLT